MTRVLVVEDEPITLQNHLDLLSEEGFEAVGVTNGSAGLRSASSDPPALILCDIGMPGLDGLDMVAALRHSPRTAGIPVVFLTARANAAYRLEGLGLGGTEFLIKPCMPDELLRAILDRLGMRSGGKPVVVEIARTFESYLSHPRLGAAFRFVDANFHRRLVLSEVAREAGYNRSYLTDLCHKETGKTIQGWIAVVRLAEVRRQLTQTDFSVDKIAAATGYCDASHLIRLFRLDTGTTPQAWRLRLTSV